MTIKKTLAYMIPGVGLILAVIGGWADGDCTA